MTTVTTMRQKPPPDGRFEGRRVVVTQCQDFMGPAITSSFNQEGAAVLADSWNLHSPGSSEALIAQAGHIDILVLNLMLRNPRTSLLETTDALWEAQFEATVHPLYRLICAVQPQMIDRRAGEIVAIGSNNGLRGIAPRSAYSAARGAQLSYVKAAGFELAEHNVQINAVAKNFVSNPSSYPEEITSSPGFAQCLAEVPAGRVAEGWESAALVLFLAGSESDFFLGQVFSFSGGWQT